MEVGFVELEHLNTPILLASIVEIKLAFLFSVELVDDPADALLADIGYGFIASIEGFALGCAGLRELNEDKLAVAVVLFVQVEDGMGGGG